MALTAGARPTITAKLLMQARSGTDPVAEADLLAGARYVAAVTARKWMRVDEEDLTQDLIAELVASKPAGLPGAAWTMATRIAGRTNVIETVGGQVSDGALKRGGGLDDVADALGVECDADGKRRFPPTVSVDHLREEVAYDPEAAPLWEVVPTPPSQVLTEALIAGVAQAMGWSERTATRAVQTLVAAMETTTTTGASPDLETIRLTGLLTKPAHARRYAREAAIPDSEWREFIRLTLATGGALARIATARMERTAA